MSCGHTGGVWESTIVKLMYLLLAALRASAHGTAREY